MRPTNHQHTHTHTLKKKRYVEKLKRAAKINAPSFRMFHVSIWNSSTGGYPRCSIGDISKKDDPTGESFVNMFGPIEASMDEEEKEENTFPRIRLAAKRSSERRRHERDTKLLQRLGATCRVAGDKAECKHKFPKTLHCLDLGAMASDDVILSGTWCGVRV